MAKYTPRAPTKKELMMQYIMKNRHKIVITVSLGDKGKVHLFTVNQLFNSVQYYKTKYSRMKMRAKNEDRMNKAIEEGRLDEYLLGRD